jgi:hypothetical protein
MQNVLIELRGEEQNLKELYEYATKLELYFRRERNKEARRIEYPVEEVTEVSREKLAKYKNSPGFNPAVFTRKNYLNRKRFQGKLFFFLQKFPVIALNYRPPIYVTGKQQIAEFEDKITRDIYSANFIFIVGEEDSENHKGYQELIKQLDKYYKRDVV